MSDAAAVVLGSWVVIRILGLAWSVVFAILCTWAVVSVTRNVKASRRELERITERLDRLPIR